VDGHAQAIADARRRDHHSRVIPERLPKLRNRRGERAFDDRYARPDGLEQLFPGDHLASVEQELVQDLERLRFQVQPDAIGS
jgi:hypothetical protein